MRRWLLKIGLGIGSISLGGCFWFDENDTIQLTDNYQLVTTIDGNSFLYLVNSQDETTEPLLTGVAETEVVGNYLAVRQVNNYYLLPNISATNEALREIWIGPLSKMDFRLKLYQLVGDSTLKLASTVH